MSDKVSAPLLHVGSKLRDRLEALAQVDGLRWQDLARQVLNNFAHMKDLHEAAQAAIAQAGPKGDHEAG